MARTRIKQNGIHYTPPELADFLARETIAHFTFPLSGTIRLLDPACGDGVLLDAVCRKLPPSVLQRTEVIGFEMEESPLELARAKLAKFSVRSVDLRHADFLAAVCDSPSRGGPSLFGSLEEGPAPGYDFIIANPPYVRTQILGALKAQELARRFGLSGRVDLYQAFVQAMTDVLLPDGILGLLTSNRFMVVQSGAVVRRLFADAFDVKAVFDLGDTKLFSAAVLPAVVVATHRHPTTTKASAATFTRVYEHRGVGAKRQLLQPQTIFAAIDGRQCGVIESSEGKFSIDRGTLDVSVGSDAPWTLTSPITVGWLETVVGHTERHFADVGKIRVGIKTTADPVFLRDDWDSLPEDSRPEDELLRRITRHDDIEPWSVSASNWRVLYTHTTVNEKRVAINLEEYPLARRYLESHRARLESRDYVVAAGRQWFEIWVPQQPGDWEAPKVVFPDIAEHPRFALEMSGAVVNGDCYWLKGDSADLDSLLLLAAVGNSSFASKYYDVRFHNKLYSGRRRFITQYVKQFPLPKACSFEAKQIVELARALIARPKAHALTAELDSLVWKAFGLQKEVTG